MKSPRLSRSHTLICRSLLIFSQSLSSSHTFHTQTLKECAAEALSIPSSRIERLYVPRKYRIGTRADLLKLRNDDSVEVELKKAPSDSLDGLTASTGKAEKKEE